MAGYRCLYHDGEQEALHIHQTIGVAGVISVCDECEPLYHIRTLADSLGLPTEQLYDVIQAFQQAGMAGTPAGQAGQSADPPEAPTGPHPAAIVDSGEPMSWDWCACDAGHPHDKDGNELAADQILALVLHLCSACEAELRGTYATIDAMEADHAASCPGKAEGTEAQ